MGPNRWRLGIRPQLTIIVLMAAVLSTVGTLFVTEISVRSYVENQARDQERENMKIAKLVLSTYFGQNVSIASDGNMVVDSPTSNGTFRSNDQTGPCPFGKCTLNGNIDYVDLVQQLINGMVSVYQCTDKAGNALVDSGGGPACKRISTTFRGPAAAGQSQTLANRAVVKDVNAKATAFPLESLAMQDMGLQPDSSGKRWMPTAHEWPNSSAAQVPIVTIAGTTYIADYEPIMNPQGQLIGVLFVGVPYDAVTSVVASTTIELVVIGTIIMVAGVILAILVASTIVGTLQRAARQVGAASERFGAIASQQASGSTQQVWAINAINQALHSLSETATDISRRTDQLAQMGNQVLQRRSEISPAQIDSVIAYVTRSMRDISHASQQQAATYERMTGAMQAVMEVAEQVAGDSQQTSENAERLESVVQQLRQLVGVSRRALANAPAATAADLTRARASGPAADAAGNAGGRVGTVQAVRPARARKSGRLAGSQPQMGGTGAMRGALGQPGSAGMAEAGMAGGGWMGPAGARGGAGMLVAGGDNQRPGQQMAQGNWIRPDAGPARAREVGPLADVGMPAFGSPMSGPMAGAGWGMPVPNSGPNRAPWSAQAGNSGPNAAPWGAAPAEAPRNPFDGGAMSGPGGPGASRRGLPPIDGLPEMGAPGTDASYPWSRRE
jgi:Single cache domain 3